MDILQTFKDLQAAKTGVKDLYLIASLPGIEHHKLGASERSNPMFFIRCEPSAKFALDVKLESISLDFDRDCELHSYTDRFQSGNYAIVCLESNASDLLEYFLESVYIVVKSLPNVPDERTVKSELSKLVALFSQLSRPPIRTIQGLWGELIVIEQSKSPDYLVRAWRKSTSDQFDFNDGQDKIEVKTTTRNRRIHEFSLGQTTANAHSELIIASIMSVETGSGKTIFDIVKLINKKLKDQSSQIRLNEVVFQTLGRDLESAANIYFDYNLSVDSLAFYAPDSIPTIPQHAIPAEVTKVRFESDLHDVASLKRVNGKSILHSEFF